MIKKVGKIDLSQYQTNASGLPPMDDPRPCRELDSGKEFNYLEIGCGDGKLFSRFRERAKVCYGVEPGNWFDEPTIVTDITKLPSGLKFDVIVLHDILEHLEDPLGMMQRCKNLSNQGARIYCSFPNKDSWVAKVRKEKWDMVRPFGHLHYFSKKSSAILFDTSKWKITERYTHPGPKIDWRNILKVKRFFEDIVCAHHQWYWIGIFECE
ncbi:MAG: class I SAM-dependent methyltransferase [Candidatus Omnitrophica bacterium]|nr:class I SAM-dependent methyltransferase [Candidatus Omnitrophota bacterium]